MDRILSAPTFVVCVMSCLLAGAGSSRVDAAAPTVLQAARVIECRSADGRPTVVTGVVVTPNGQSIVTATDDHSVSLWDANTGELQRRFESHADWVRTVAVSPDGMLLASGANDHTVCLWDLAERQRLFQLPACDGAVACVRVHANGQQVAVAGLADSLQIINVSSGQVTQRLECAGFDQRAVAFSADGIRMAAAGRNGRIRIWNLASGVHERDVETGGRLIRTLDFSPDGQLIVAAGDGPHALAIEAATGQTIRTLNVRPAKVYAVLFLDHRQIATAGSDNRILVWNVEDGQPVLELAGHTGTVAALATSANGKRLVSGSFDTTVRVWELDIRTPDAVEARMPTQPVR